MKKHVCEYCNGEQQIKFAQEINSKAVLDYDLGITQDGEIICWSCFDDLKDTQWNQESLKFRNKFRKKKKKTIKKKKKS